MRNKPKLHLLFYALLAYFILQFAWWEVLLARQSAEIADGQMKIEALQNSDPITRDLKLKQIEEKKNRQLWMHAGEGTVFLILMVVGLLKIYDAQKKENELNKRQSNFLLSITHELKSPLASIQLQLQTLQKLQLSEEKRKEILNYALQDARRFSGLIEKFILASGRGKHYTLKSNTEKSNVNELIQSLLDDSFSAQKERIQCEIPVNFVYNCPKEVLRAILLNLIENALNYSPLESGITLKAYHSNDTSMLEVKDLGCGIPEQERTKIFEKFYRIGNEETRTAPGTGLGLYIVGELCREAHILIRVENNNPHGSVFCLLDKKN